MDYKNLIDRLAKEKQFKEKMDFEIQQDELKFLWTAVEPLVDFICFVNFERKYKIRHYGLYNSFIMGKETEEEFRERMQWNVFNLGQFKEKFMCKNPEIIDITVESNSKIFKLNIVGITPILTDKGLEDGKKIYNSIDELVFDISNYLIDEAVILE